MSYTATTTGLPCWYELGTSDLDGASAFYTAVLGWTVVSAGMPGMDYRLGNASDGTGVAGLMEDDDPVPSAWRFYLEVADCDAAAEAVVAAGGTVLSPPADIPGTGRFAVCTDPQGAVFALLSPAPMDDAPSVGAFAATVTGHGAWHELSTPDPEAALDFYAGLVGWTKGVTMDMGSDGDYQLFQAQGNDLGGIMRPMPDQGPAWLSYFTVDSVAAAAERITAGGGTVLHGPVDVPGGAFIAIAADPQGASFGVTGPQ